MRTIDDFERLFLERVPMLDVRAPVEFNKGAFPGATNIPLLDDEERSQVGIRYKQEGNQRAVELGHQLVWGERKDRRLQQWCDFARQNPQGCLYCFRGGQRSRIVQQWLKESGIDYPRVAGGYKAMRRYLINITEELSGRIELLLLGGRTGVGKTEVLLKLPKQIDLEGLANHRGSGFGRMLSPQPSQINFEHPLAIAMMRFAHVGEQTLVLEDESRTIGQRAIPGPLWEQMKKAPVVLLEDSMESRIKRTRRDYVDQMAAGLLARHPQDGRQRFEKRLHDSLSRISERLGGRRYREIKAQMDQALLQQHEHDDFGGHEIWIERLLVEYYDPMYDYQIANKQERIRHTGNATQVTDFLTQPAGL
jgi:tRNA 2-selenouridine synthase